MNQEMGFSVVGQVSKIGAKVRNLTIETSFEGRLLLFVFNTVRQLKSSKRLTRITSVGAAVRLVLGIHIVSRSCETKAIAFIPFGSVPSQLRQVCVGASHRPSFSSITG